ncbi:MAG: ferredoxin--NADP reductase [Planctomycetota bacterium]|jgi:ferredoxin--NADP+ reductase
MTLQWISGRISEKTIWQDGLFTLKVDCPGVNPFECGQFLQLGLQTPEKHLHRPYSVASPPGDQLEFFIVRVEGGELTTRLWPLQAGDSIDVSAKATGGFTLSHTPPAECLWLLATGTGLAPYIAMLRDPGIWQKYPHIVVVHGVRYRSEFAYASELHGFTTQFPGRFSYVPIASRENTDHGFQGRITTAIECGILERMAGHSLTPQQSAVMMCGNPQMLDDVELLLHTRGLQKHKRSEPGHYVVERYW